MTVDICAGQIIVFCKQRKHAVSKMIVFCSKSMENGSLETYTLFPNMVFKK